MLFDGFGGDSDDFSEFSGRIIGVIFEQLEDFLPTFLLFLPTFQGSSYYFPPTVQPSEGPQDG